MLSLKHYLRGDTLIEVTIAIGIFALVAISVVAVVSVSTSGAQLSLENTLTREEVDAQAETIRFLQGIIDANGSINITQPIPNTKDGLYQAIWLKLQELANDNSVDGIDNSLISFDSDTCKNIYNGNTLAEQNAFIIDLKKLNAFDENKDNAVSFAKEVVRVVGEDDNRKLFIPASTYPQLVYTRPEDSSLLGGSDLRNAKLESVEGIYVVGVQDANKTNVITQDASTGEVKVEMKPAYYDFYVRSCWYNSGSENPSSISTAVRVHDPDAIAHIEPVQPKPEEPEIEEVTFENIEWKHLNDRTYQGCSGCSEPYAGTHVTFPNDTSIQLIGSTASSVSLGTYWDKFSVKDPFSLQVDIDASNIGTHPSENGSFVIAFEIVDEAGSKLVSGVEASIAPSVQTISIPDTSQKITMNSKTFNLLLEYNRGKFKACVKEQDKGQQCISATKQIPADSYLKVGFYLNHGSHCCCMNAIVKLSNIQMRRASTGTITF